MDKKAYFFVIDAIMAILVMTVGVVLVFSFHKFAPLKQQSSISSADVFSLLNTKVRNLNNDYCGINSNLTRDMNITDVDNTLLEQIAEIYYRNLSGTCAFCDQMLKNVISNVTVNMPDDRDFLMKLDGKVIYQHNLTPMGDARIVIPSRRVVQTLYNSTEFVGPYLAEVYLWQ